MPGFLVRFYHGLQSHVMGEVVPSPLQACVADEVEVLCRCRDWLERLKRGEEVVVNLRPETDAETESNRRGHTLSGTPSQATSPSDPTTARRCLGPRTGSGITAARPHPRVVPPPRNAWAKWATCISFVPHSKWPVRATSALPSQWIQGREVEMTVQCQCRANCAGVYRGKIRTYDERMRESNAALTAEKTSESLLLPTKRLFSCSGSGSCTS